MINFIDSCNKKFGLIEYRSKKHGSYLYSPVYSPLEIIVSARGKQGFRGKKEMLVVYEDEDKESISPFEFEVIRGDCAEIIPVKDDYENELYIINPRNDNVVVKFLIGLYLTDFSDSDIEHDNHMSSFLLSFAENIRNGIGARDEKDRLRLAREVYRYVSRMPTIPYKQKIGKVRTPSKSIESGTAHNICICKSEIFKDLCRLLDIPAREQITEHYNEQDVREYSKTKKESRKEQLHSFCAFYTDKWCLADPTLGGFNSTFRVKEYYREIFSAKGFDKIAVEARRL